MNEPTPPAGNRILLVKPPTDPTAVRKIIATAPPVATEAEIAELAKIEAKLRPYVDGLALREHDAVRAEFKRAVNDPDGVLADPEMRSLKERHQSALDQRTGLRNAIREGLKSAIPTLKRIIGAHAQIAEKVAASVEKSERETAQRFALDYTQSDSVIQLETVARALAGFAQHMALSSRGTVSDILRGYDPRIADAIVTASKEVK
jgi:hypothetical protein